MLAMVYFSIRHSIGWELYFEGVDAVERSRPDGTSSSLGT